MENILFTSVVLTLINVFLLIYINTLHLYPKAWIDKTNSNPQGKQPGLHRNISDGDITVNVL